MRKWAAAVLIAASFAGVGTSLTADASHVNATGCKTVKVKETRLVWNAKHTKRVRVDVTKLVKESIKQDGHRDVFYVKVQVYRTERVCTAATSVTAPTTTVAPVPTTSAPVTAVVTTSVPSPPPSITTTTVPATTTTTSTTMPTLEASISTVFVDPDGTTTVTGQFSGVESLTLTGSAANSCSAAIINDSAQCTLPGGAEFGAAPMPVGGGHPTPDVLTVASSAGTDTFALEASTQSGLPTYWEYPAPTESTEPLTTDGPVGTVTVVSDPDTTDCGTAATPAPTACSVVEIQGDYPEQGAINLNSDTSGEIDFLGSLEINNPTSSGSASVEVAGTPQSLEAVGTFEIIWDGGTDFDGYGFPEVDFPGFTRVMTFSTTTGAWS